MSDGTKSIPEDNLEAVWSFVRETLDRDFWPDKKRKTPNFSAAAAATKISQPTLSDLYNRKKGKGIGIAVLMKLADYANTSVDVIVGRGPKSGETKPKPATNAELYAAQLFAEGVSAGSGALITHEVAGHLVANMRNITQLRKELTTADKTRQRAIRDEKSRAAAQASKDAAAAAAAAKAAAEEEERRKLEAVEAARRRHSKAG